MAEPVRARRLTDEEGRRLQQIVRRGKHDSIRVRRRKLADYLASNPVRRVVIGRERLRQLLRRNDISFQRTRTWKESTDPNKDAKLDRIEEVTTRFPDRCFAFDQFGPLSIRPHHGPSDTAPAQAAPR
jgi:hypothetical protein